MRPFVRTIATLLTSVLLLALANIPSTLAQLATSGAETRPNNMKPPLQIVNHTGLKVVVQVNSPDTVPNGVSKQVLAAKNLYDQYTALGMKPGKDFEIAMVFRGDGAQFLLTDEAYDQKVKATHPKGNPSRALIDAMSQGGVAMYECAVAMKLKGYTAQEILPYSRIVTSGIGALVDFEKSGYLPITP